MSKENQPDGKDTVNDVVKKVEVDGLEIETKTVDGVVEVPIPQEIKDQGEEAVEKFKRHTEDIINQGNRNYKKGQELNEERTQFEADVEKHKAEIEEKDEKLKELEAEVEKQRTLNVELTKGQPKNDVPSLKNLLAKRLGKKTLTADEIRDVQDENPELYLSVQSERQDLLMEGFRKESYNYVKDQVSKDMIEDVIRREGYDVAKVEKFKLDNGFTDISKAFSFFKTQNKPVPSPIDIVNKAEGSKKTVKFIESGNVQHHEKRNLEDMTNEEIDNLSPEENQRLYNEQVKNR